MLLCKEQQYTTNMNSSSSPSKNHMLVKCDEICSFIRFLKMDGEVIWKKLPLECYSLLIISAAPACSKDFCLH